jgi:UPF0755 protein
MKVRRIVGLLILLIILSLLGAYAYYGWGLKPAASGEPQAKQVDIPKGTGLSSIARLFKTEGIIRDYRVFELYCKLNGLENKIKAGKYNLDNTMGVPEIVDKIVSGQALIDTVKLTIPEGYNMEQILEKIDALGVVDSESIRAALNKQYDYEFFAQIPDREKKLEGYLFPDTYELYKDTTAEAIIDKMLGRFNDVFNEEYRNRAKELNMSMDQVLTLASIIEREAKLDSERKIISGVFHNRLKKNMMLQSCATVQYLFKEQKEVLTFKDLEIESPYNTYKHAGLPPGPIASPGQKSIEAALYPEVTDYLYFVAKNDGSHVFTKTYSEHLNAQNKINR